MWLVIRHRRIVCLGANGPAGNFLHGFAVDDGYCVLIGEVDEHSRTRTLEFKPFNVVAFDPQLTGFLVCTEVDSDQEGMVERHGKPSDALDAATCLQIKNLNRLVVLACKKEPTSFFVHGKMIEISGKPGKRHRGFQLQRYRGLGRCTEARSHRNYKEEDDAQNPPASF